MIKHGINVGEIFQLGFRGERVKEHFSHPVEAFVKFDSRQVLVRLHHALKLGHDFFEGVDVVFKKFGFATLASFPHHQEFLRFNGAVECRIFLKTFGCQFFVFESQKDVLDGGAGQAHLIGKDAGANGAELKQTQKDRNFFGIEAEVLKGFDEHFVGLFGSILADFSSVAHSWRAENYSVDLGRLRVQPIRQWQLDVFWFLIKLLFMQSSSFPIEYPNPDTFSGRSQPLMQVPPLRAVETISKAIADNVTDQSAVSAVRGRILEVLRQHARGSHLPQPATLENSLLSEMRSMSDLKQHDPFIAQSILRYADFPERARVYRDFGFQDHSAVSVDAHVNGALRAYEFNGQPWRKILSDWLQERAIYEDNHDFLLKLIEQGSYLSREYYDREHHKFVARLERHVPKLRAFLSYASDSVKADPLERFESVDLLTGHEVRKGKFVHSTRHNQFSRDVWLVGSYPRVLNDVPFDAWTYLNVAGPQCQWNFNPETTLFRAILLDSPEESF